MSHPRSYVRAAALTAAFTVTLAGALAGQAVAGDPVGLGTADSFAVLAGAGITNTGPTTITGDVGTFETTTRTGFASVTLIGTDHGGDSVTQGAKDDLVVAYDDAAGRSPATSVPVELGGTTLLEGVYTSPTFGLTGTLTLDAQGRTDAQFVFQAGTTLITEPNSRVLLVNGASPCQVVWQVGSSATFKTGTRFAGDVLALSSITAQTSATFVGRLLARNGAVTLDTNTISNGACAAGPVATASPTTAAPTTAAPTPAASATASPRAVAPRATTAPGTTGGTTGGTTSGGTTSGGSAAGGPAAPTLPDTGLRLPLAVAGLVLVGAGWLLVAVAKERGRHRRSRFA